MTNIVNDWKINNEKVYKVLMLEQDVKNASQSIFQYILRCLKKTGDHMACFFTSATITRDL